MTGQVWPAAFDDRYEKQSFFVARIVASPRVVLEFFCNLPPVQRFYGRVPTAEDLWNDGDGVAALPAASILELGLRLIPSASGTLIRPDGHVDVHRAKEFAIQLSRVSHALTEDEVLG